jgi:hypothetical protein
LVAGGSTLRGRLLIPAALAAAGLACSLPSAGAPTREPTPGPPIPSPGPTLVGEPAAGTAAPPSTSPDSTPIAIIGDPPFVEQTRLALALLEENAPEAYQKVLRYIGVIAQDERSGMWAAEEPPRYAVSDTTAFYSLTWYASTIAHDATHSELYHEHLATHPGEVVPDDVWIGVESERFCNAYQLDVLRRIGGPSQEVDYLAGLAGTHCDIDGDQDCDWDDYEGRDW